MIDRFRDIARALVAVLLLGIAGAAAQTAQSQTSPNPGAAPQASSVPTAQAPALPAGPAGPQINIAEITARANRDVGVNIETTINGWQHELDRLESDLRRPRLRYSELNDFRDELQRVRAGIEDFSNRLAVPDSPPQRISSICSGRRQPLANHQSQTKLPSIGPNSITSSGCYRQVKLRSSRPICGSIS